MNCLKCYIQIRDDLVRMSQRFARLTHSELDDLISVGHKVFMQKFRDRRWTCPDHLWRYCRVRIWWQWKSDYRKLCKRRQLLTQVEFDEEQIIDTDQSWLTDLDEQLTIDGKFVVQFVLSSLKELALREHYKKAKLRQTLKKYLSSQCHWSRRRIRSTFKEIKQAMEVVSC